MDPRMAAELTKQVQATPSQKRLQIVVGDFVKAELPYFDVCIFNTPYKISSTIVFCLLSHRPLFHIAILMFQQEFTRHLVAQPGSSLWSRLSANVQLYAKVDHIRDVKRNNFRPAPQVKSSVVRLVPRDPPPPVKFEEFDGLTRVIFSCKNKTVWATFLHAGVISMLENNWRTVTDNAVDFKDYISELTESTDFTEQHAVKMSVNDLLKLMLVFHDKGIHFA
ncbi:S-adenosyl-L-methionine-dependent methyltransferase [Mycena pura]|uniref:rRNA adenine N(6)-methyltransferase n=1 Tax=Mycena pura TaxID=153505 RepID=A0AAD6VGF9_9AGAR|nr:S-adenosyl-L-methionine-dependent methyltransferase [Mycena pura]